MKKIIIILLLLTPFFSFSQTTKPIDGFLGIKFGSSKAAVLAAIKARGGRLDKANSTKNLVFDNITFAHRKVDFLVVRFVDDKAFEADFNFVPQDNSHAVDYYNSLANDVTENYGKGEETKKFSDPYKDGDGQEMTALLIGAADFSTLWQAANENTILVKIKKTSDNDLNIELSYQDSKLTDQAIAKQKAEDKGDF